ncbi:glycosyltransferase [Aphanothece sacrum]|uniref:Glycosyl transferase n=1 Tax=Aphanothece sacrum FPU1 TaxID=1920663 RepID=A0A401IM00_APHSA|nr:glycosyltransferase [Aphanothece sacrum]GBF82290.1 glycosyl transferase [Aphanothece sacrum FPU1]GBF84191.1 glycosyl transferase [Aphanothece sacrum FPU3]
MNLSAFLQTVIKVSDRLTFEVMAYGKVILGTTVAFRGYPVASGKEGIICDRLDEYPSLIAQLLNNPKKRQ